MSFSFLLPPKIVCCAPGDCLLHLLLLPASSGRLDSDHVGLSAEYFTKLFKKETGQSIKEYITLMKVEAAKNMLAHSNISVGMVALELGYSNFPHFSQVLIVIAELILEQGMDV